MTVARANVVRGRSNEGSDCRCILQMEAEGFVDRSL